MHSLIQRNNTLSVLLLLGFPAIILGAVYLFMVLAGDTSAFMSVLPWVLGIVAIWFTIAYFSNTSMIKHAVQAEPLLRRDNPRVYNIVENLTMACGMPMPKINIVDDPQLNAFASGINNNTYTVTLTTGIIDRLDDDELAGVVGHELTHIRNNDTRLLITSIVFVGIISTAMTLIVRGMWHAALSGGGRSSRGGKEKTGGILIMLVIALVCAAIAYLFVLLTRFAISRKREYMADAGGAELCGNPMALASALRKISGDPGLANVDRDDIAQMYICHPQALNGKKKNFLSSLFSTHPSIETRIQLLEQY